MCQCNSMGFLLLILTLTTLPPLLIYEGFRLRMASQKKYDQARRTYEIVLPTGLTEDRVQAFIRSIGSSQTSGVSRLLGVPTVAFETHYTDKGIYHRIRVPSARAEYLVSQLHGHLPGIDVTPVDDPEVFSFTDGASIGLSNTSRTVRMANIKDIVTRLLNSVSVVEGEEHVVVQWVISHSDRKKETTKPRVKSSSFSFLSAVVFGTDAGQPEITDRKAKESEQNFMATGRIGVVATDSARASSFLTRVVQALRAENDDNRFEAKRIPKSKLHAINDATTPLWMGAQFTVTELTPLIAWPIGDPAVPGLRQGTARRLPATEAHAREGRVLGHSNVSGRERPIAVSYDEADKHMVVVGMIGSGKSVLMANSAHQDMKRGYGVIVVDAAESVSSQSLYNRVLNLVPPERANDVITVNVFEDADHPVGFDLFGQGMSGAGSIDQIVGVFESLYPEVATGVSVRDLLYHGLATLVERGGHTIVDLAALISPKNKTEEEWAKSIIDGVQDQELKDFWDRNWPKKEADKVKWERYAEPLHRRLWQLTGRPETRHMLAQTEGGLRLEDVIRDNKILLVSLGGLPSATAELLATLLVDTIWHIAQRTTPDKGNMLYLDEFQVSTNLKAGLENMLRLGRKHKLWLTMGTQYIHTLNRPVQQAIKNSVKTQVIFETGADEAAIWLRQLPIDGLRERDLTTLPQYTAIARIAGPGSDSPVTFKALAPIQETNLGDMLTARSRRTYGKPVNQVKSDILARRLPPERPTKSRPPVGWA